MGVRSVAWTQPRAEVKVVRVVGEAPDEALHAAAGVAGGTLKRLAVTRVTLLFQQPLHCNGCVKVCKEVLGELRGVKEVEVTPDKLRAHVVYDTVVAKTDQMLAVLADWGKPASVER
jgi:copper chaperone CopZ